MKKNFIIIAILLLGVNCVKAQMNVGSIAAPQTRSMLQVSGNTKGFLPPRLTTAQRDAIASTANGLVIYNTDFPAFSPMIP